MDAAKGRSPLKDVSASQVVEAIDVLAGVYMTFFGVRHVTPHIVRCLLEVVCPEVAEEVKSVVLEKSADLPEMSVSRYAAETLGALLGGAGVPARDALLRCGGESQRLRVKMALRRQPAASAQKVVLERLMDAKGGELETLKELQDLRGILHAYEGRIQAMEDELRREQPDYSLSAKMHSSRIGRLIDATKTALAGEKPPDKQEQGTHTQPLVMAGVGISRDTMDAAVGYNPSRDFVLKAARQLFAESLVPTMSNDNGESKHNYMMTKHQHGPYPERETAPVGMPRPNNSSVRSAGASIPEFSHKMLVPAQCLPCDWHVVGGGHCDTVPPTMEVLSSESFHTLMADKRPLRVQEEDREARLKAWTALGKIRLSSSDSPNGPAAYTRLSGLHHLIKMEQQITHLLFKKIEVRLS